MNDGDEANDIFYKMLKEANRVLKKGCCCCGGGGGGGPDPQFARWSLWLDEDLEFKQMIIWDKGPMGMGWHYRRSYETILIAQKKGASCKWYDITKKIENIIRPGTYGIKKIIPSKNEHPTPKSVNLMKHFIGLHSKEDDTILDPFMGHAPVGMACKQMNRNYIGIELDKFWYDKAVIRLNNTQESML